MYLEVSSNTVSFSTFSMTTDATGTKKCPHCAEKILAEAKKCKHCGEYVDARRFRNFKGVKPVPFSRIEIACPNCGYEGRPRTYTGGSTAVELLLWLCFLAPGVIYSFWRLSTRCYVCPNCGCREINKA